MNNTSRSHPSLDPLAISSYVVVFAVSIPALWSLFSNQEPSRWIATGLLATFAVLNFLPENAVRGLKLRHPHLYMAVMAALITGLALLPPGTPWFVVLFFILSADVMLRFPGQTGYAWVGVFSALTVISFLLTGRNNPGILLTAPLYIAGYFFFAAFAAQTAHAEAARAESQRLLDELQAAHRTLQEYVAQAGKLAIAEERNRLAREMHDTLGHRLTVVAVQLQVAERLVSVDLDRATQMIGTVREQVREALGELRQTVATMRAALEVDLPLPVAVQQLASSFEQATGILVHTDFAGDLTTLPPPHRHALYRGAQEGLTNIQRHARASEAWVGIWDEGAGIRLLVEDNGVGMPRGDIPLGFGLRGLRERADQLGGIVEFGPGDTTGSRLSLYVPLTPGRHTNGSLIAQPEELTSHD
jgi:signal transduction histidine kinase